MKFRAEELWSAIARGQKAKSWELRAATSGPWQSATRRQFVHLAFQEMKFGALRPGLCALDSQARLFRQPDGRHRAAPMAGYRRLQKLGRKAMHIENPSRSRKRRRLVMGVADFLALRGTLYNFKSWASVHSESLLCWGGVAV
jgi:hypothetical protein